MSDTNKRQEIITGSIELDEDLQALFELLSESTKVNTVKEAISDSSLTFEQFIDVVSPDIVRLSSSLLTKEKYAKLLKSLPENAIATVKKAKSMIEKNFGDILNHPAIKSILRDGQRDEKSETETLTGDAFNTIEDITWVQTWRKTRSGLLPTARLGLQNNRGKILLDSTLDWEQLSYMIYRLMQVFSNLLENAKAAVELEQLDLSDRDRLAREIRYMQELLDNITKFASYYKIKVEKKSKKSSRRTKSVERK